MFIFWCRSFSCNRLAVLIWKMVPKTTNKNTHYHLGYLYKKFLYLLLHTWKHLTFSLPPSNYSIVHTLRLACPEFCGKTSWLFWKGWCHQGDQASSFCVWVKLPRLARVPLKRLRVGPQESSLVQLPIVPGHRCHADTCSCGQTGSALSCNSSRFAFLGLVFAGSLGLSSLRASLAQNIVRTPLHGRDYWTPRMTPLWMTERRVPVAFGGHFCLWNVRPRFPLHRRPSCCYLVHWAPRILMPKRIRNRQQATPS